MSTLREVKVVDTLVLVLFVVLIGGGILFCIPTDFEMGQWHAMSFDTVQAERLLRKTISTDSSNPLVVRNLAELLERKGQTKEAIQWLWRLTELRPRNEGYWQRLVQILEWEGETAQALLAREAMLFSGATELSAGKLRELARDFEWFQRYVDAGRIYELMWKRGLYNQEDVEDILRFFFRVGKWKWAEQFADDSIKAGKVTLSIHQTLAWSFNDLRKTSKAVEHIAAYLGVDPEHRRQAWDDSAFIETLSSDTIKKEQELLSDLIWMYVNNRKGPLAIRVLKRLGREEFLSVELEFTLAELLEESGKADEALDILIALVERGGLEAREWRRIATHLMRLGQSSQASRILERLLEDQAMNETILK